jgi:IS5 family transposase
MASKGSPRCSIYAKDTHLLEVVIMRRSTLSDIEYGMRKRTTKRDEFLRIMEQSIPWDEWVAYILPYYPKGKRGRPPMGVEKMLRMYLLQC